MVPHYYGFPLSHKLWVLLNSIIQLFTVWACRCSISVVSSIIPQLSKIIDKNWPFPHLNPPTPHPRSLKLPPLLVKGIVHQLVYLAFAHNFSLNRCILPSHAMIGISRSPFHHVPHTNIINNKGQQVYILSYINTYIPPNNDLLIQKLDTMATILKLMDLVFLMQGKNWRMDMNPYDGLQFCILYTRNHHGFIFHSWCLVFAMLDQLTVTTFASFLCQFIQLEKIPNS